ncbi:UV radiation resistance-associated gene protein [Anopheles nili]|uniref:UV radiation resistance-associated gene protein n=1 Tax=Anopheles nili TaxID=185578 RepID=UPI00237BD5F6|nr:UV radiation resistance-associated gene protein [Anopheles nili]XP_053674932.1 UV radiation resistance-associated gene protein [Anopheles nili]
MFDRPRCRDWSPLSTQQLRLRSLIQISGHNITLPDTHPNPTAPLPAPIVPTGRHGRPKCTVYFTLHHAPQSAPFYTSERLDLHRNVLWAEIDCPGTIKSSLRGVCVRVWEHIETPAANGVLLEDGHVHTIVPTGANVDVPPCGTKVPQDGHVVDDRLEEHHGSDRMLFTWGVYFSGLVPLERRNEKRLRPNTLVFQLHGGYFTSAAYILEPHEQPPAVAGTTTTTAAAAVANVADGMIPKTIANAGHAGTPPSATIPIVGVEAGWRGGSGRGTTPTENVLHCDTSNNSSPVAATPQQFHLAPSSTSPNQWSFANGGALLGVEQRYEKLSVSPAAGSNSSGISTAIHRVRSTSPPAMSWTGPTETNLKLRYLLMEFPTAEVRASYDLLRLLAVQERQRRIRYEADSAKSLADRICMKSAYCLNLELFSSNHLVYRTAVNHRTGGMGKQLSRLLYQEREPIEPTILLRGQELRRRIERAKFRCRLLAQERDRICGDMQQLRNQLNVACDSNIERESALMERYRTYGREKEHLYQQKMAYASQKDSVREICAKMLTVRHQLLTGLNEIYYIKSTSQGIYTINDVPLPNAESYTDSTPALVLSVALGFVAHAVMMCSTFLDIPLRNPIKYDGSRSKIVDHIKLLPTVDRDFPLHCRSGPAPNAVLYGVYLLNQNISQLKHQLSMSRGDPRATLVNLHGILSIPGIGGTLLNRALEEPFQMLPASVFGSSSVDLKMSPGFLSLPGGSSSCSSSSGSYFRDSPSSSSRISRSVDNYTDRFQDRRLQILHHRPHQNHRHPLQQARHHSSSSGSAVDQDHHLPQRRGCGDNKFSSDPILAQAPLERPFDFEGGKKF